MDRMNQMIKINVGGQLFLTKLVTLQRFPGTKLSNITETCEYFDILTDEYYFDRSPLIFQSILDYYRTGKLHFLSNICPEHIREELEFWDISASDLKPCCWKHFYTVDNDLKTVSVIKKQLFQTQLINNYTEKIRPIRERIWILLEYPKTSKLAMIWQLFYLAIVCLAIIAVICQSFEISRPERHLKRRGRQNSTLHVRDRLMDHDDWGMSVTHLCNVVFAMETILRFYTCPDRWEFIKSFLNIIVIISIIGYLILVIIREFPNDNESIFIFAYILTVLRGFRFYRLERLIEGLRFMLLSIKQSKKMFCMLVLILLITSLIFGIIIHVMEMDGAFSDLVSCFYWAIITMTTIGCGDIYLTSFKGKIIASACAIFGLFLLAMPIAVVANAFNDLNNKYSGHQNHLKKNIKCLNRKRKKGKLYEHCR